MNFFFLLKNVLTKKCKELMKHAQQKFPERTLKV